MGYVIRMPQLGMSMDEGTVVEWRFDEGDTVEEGTVVAIVESEKAANDVEAREDGTVRAILVSEGDTVEPGTPIGIVADADEDLNAYEAEIGADIEARTDAGPDAGSTGAEGSTAATGTDADAAGGTDSPDRTGNVKATPGARRLAEQEGIDLAAVDGTGPQGVVTDDDVESYLESAAEADESGGTVRTVVESGELSGVQRTVSERLSESAATAVHVTLNRSFDAGTVRAVADAADGTAADVSITDLLIKAAAETLSSFPEFNALFEDGEHKLIEEVNVGVATDIEDGLVTPVIPAADGKSVEALHRIRARLGERVQSGEYTMDDLSGGTFTVSNLGPYGVDDFDPVINPPEIAILGVGRIRDDGAMTLSLSFDHRVVNGADAARFLDALVSTLTDRTALVGFFGTELSVEGGPSDREIRIDTAEGLSGRYRTAYGDVAFDEPQSVGGSGSAPSPVDHLLGALGSCLSLSVRTQAERDDVAIGAIETAVHGSPEHGPLESVELELELETDADEGAIEKAVTKGEHACYVARTLSDDVPVDVEWTRA